MRYLISFFLIFVSILSFSQLKLDSISICKKEAFVNCDSVICHTAYVLSYNQTTHQANWVAYLLTEAMTEKAFDRTNNFKADPLIPGTDLAKDYQKSGYDRGHLVPAADMGFSELTMTESFYYSNMSPQVPGFNRGVWKRLEGNVRDWAVVYDSLYIVVGPIFSDTMKVIGPHQLAVPNAYFKVVLDCRKGKEKMIGFVLNNEGSKNSLESFVVAVDSIEFLTGLDLFPSLPDELELRLESEIVLEGWKW
jgi:endonuclease G, mitochondrial